MGLLYAREQWKCFEVAMKLLPEPYRQVILLKRLEGLSYKEIAERLGTTVSNVGVRLHRAESRLKSLLRVNCSEYF
jgi:RNA polymerase sigma factor (sigma-70 family)